MSAANQFLADHRADALERLKQFLAIPSISTDPRYEPHLEAGVNWVAGRLEDLGLTTTVIPTEGHAAVVGRSNEASGPRRDAPRVLFYGHYDVQPPDPLDQWTTGPFEPTVRNGAIYARGASDDKGQVMCFLEALGAWRATAGRLPVHVTVLIEGEEEMGSPHLRSVLESHRDALAADVALISDTTMWEKGTIAITYGLRGLLYFDIQLHNSNRDLHSGMYGGTLANPATMLPRVLGRLFDDEHRVTIPGFYDQVEPLSDEERAQWDALGFDQFAHCLGPVGVQTPFGESGFTTLQRKWARPSCDVNGLYGGYGGEGAKTVIPRFAGAKVSFRLAPRQDPDRIAAAFETWVRSQDVGGCRWEIQHLGGCHPVIVRRDTPFMEAAVRAVREASGRPPVFVREGATIPAVSDFQQILGLESLLVGFGLPEDRIHAPDEKFDLENFDLGCRTHALLLGELGGGQGTEGPRD